MELELVAPTTQKRVNTMAPSLLASNGAGLLQLDHCPGETAFKVKGLAYRGHLEYTARFVPGGIEAHNAAFQDHRVARYFEQPFMAASTYDVIPLAQGGVVCGELTGLGFRRFLSIRSKIQAEADIRGVYKYLLKLVSTEAVALRLPKLIAQYFDFLQTEITERGPSRIRGIQHGAPEVLAPWIAIVSHAYLATILEQTGAKPTRLDITRGAPEGERGGLPLIGIEFHIEW